ncbi:MAG TPA: dihydrodipicolinate reductase [Myxococcaceae bacterium]|nr:dihydrodipicolinate reductase [Myxococcaceae bacterium]
MGGAPSGPVPVVVMGLGHVGREICRAALASEEVELLGAVDPGRGLSGAQLSEVLGLPSDLRVSGTLAAAAGKRRPAVVLQATAGRLSEVVEELLDAVRQGHPVVSTCEELCFPYLRHPALAERIDRAAHRSGVAVLGTGVHPGFVLDRLVATVGQAVGPVRHVHATRSIDAAAQPEDLRRRVGAGLTEEEFAGLAEQDAVGQAGLVESAALCALGLGMDCDDFEEELLPLIAEEDHPGPPVPVVRGRVAGVHQTCVGLQGDQERVRLEVTLALGAASLDRMVLDADRRLTVEIPGGLGGESSTAHLVVHAAPRLTQATPGLLTVLDLPAGR